MFPRTDYPSSTMTAHGIKPWMFVDVDGPAVRAWAVAWVRILRLE